jgi:hypothetical protein
VQRQHDALRRDRALRTAGDVVRVSCSEAMDPERVGSGAVPTSSSARRMLARSLLVKPRTTGCGRRLVRLRVGALDERSMAMVPLEGSVHVSGCREGALHEAWRSPRLPRTHENSYDGG